MKRSDLSTLRVLQAVQDHGTAVWSMLCADYPPKLVLAAIEREVRAGRLNYGVSANLPWLEPAGERWLNAHTIDGALVG